MQKFFVCVFLLVAFNGVYARPNWCVNEKIQIVRDCGVWRYAGGKKSFDCKTKLPDWFAVCGQRKCALWRERKKKICWFAKNTVVPYGTSRHIASCKKLKKMMKRYCRSWVENCALLRKKKICWFAKNTVVPHGTSRHIAFCKKLRKVMKRYCRS
jgi:hypothetical protein